MRRRAAGVVALVASVALALAPAGGTGAGEVFLDLGVGGVHEAPLRALASVGVFDGTGCGDGRLCPGGALLRWEMAVWLVRVVEGGDPGAVGSSRFEDVDGGVWWAAHVERLADLGITVGCSRQPARFCPYEAVSRAQMASFVVRAFGLEPAPSAGFVDTGTSSHRASIDALFAAGVTRGCVAEPLAYCGARPTTRAQMASFLHRAAAGAGVFLDLAGTGVHEAPLRALASVGVFDGTGCGDGRLCPGGAVLRWEMAVWLVRVLEGADPGAVGSSRFEDVDGDVWWAAHVERLADLGITVGCSRRPARFCPHEAVSRAQMASFMVRAFGLEAAPAAGFVDTETSSHRANIDALFAAGVTRGCVAEPLTYCPARPTTRAQMASFLHRASTAASSEADDAQDEPGGGGGPPPGPNGGGGPPPGPTDDGDDDHPTVRVSFAQAAYSVAEGDSVTVTVNLDEDPQRRVEVPITARGTGGAGSGDYSLSQTTVVFNRGDTTATFTFTAAGDSVDDDGESVLLGFGPGPLPADVSAGAGATATVSIVDDDGPAVEVSFAQPSHDVAEGEEVTVRVYLDKDPERTVQVPITAHPDGADDDDYTVPTTVVFNRGDTSRTFTFTAVDDRVDDDGERVLLRFGHPLPDRVSTGSTDEATVAIGDNDIAGVSMSLSELTVDEGGEGAYEVWLDSEPTATVRVTVGGHSGSDVSVLPRSLSFGADNWGIAQTVTVTAAADGDAASDAAVRLTHTVAGFGEYAGVGAAAVVVTIVEDDVSVLSVSGVSGPEDGAALVFTVDLSRATGERVTVDYATSDSTAEAGSDYTGTSGTLTFAADSTAAQTVSVPVADDAADEDEEETFTLTLSNARGASLAGGVSTLAVTGTIVDNDDPEVEVSFEQSSYDVAEGESVTVTVNLDKAPERRVDVPITAEDRGGATSGDLLDEPETVTFRADQTTATFTLTAFDDSDNDDGESVLLRLGTLPRVSAGTNATAEVNLVDNDHPEVEVSFEQSSYSVTEGSPETVTVTVRLSTNPEREVEVRIETANRGAADDDYLGVPDSVTFGADQTTATFTLTAFDDSVDDDDESVVLGFGRPLPVGVRAGSPAEATVAIVDDDDPAVELRFARSSYSVAEGSPETVTVTLDKDPERTVVVPISPAGEGGASGSDYSVVPGSVTFRSGDTSETFTFRAVDDDVDDDGESVVLGFGRPLPDGVRAGSPDEATVAIVDGDTAGVSVSPRSLSVSEGGGGAYQVVLDSEPTAAVTVTVGGYSGSDVSVSPGSLVFGAGNWHAAQTVTVTAAADDDAASDAAVRLTHTVAGSGEYAGVGAAAVVVTILEVDASVLSVDGVSGAENGGGLVFTVDISRAVGKEVTVAYATSDGTARAGSDYTSTSGTLTFAANSTAAQTVTVPIINDTADENEQETFTLTLSSAVGASLAGGGSTLAATGIIIDDDDPGVAVSFGASSYSVAEGESVTVTVELDADPERTVDVHITPTPQDNASNSDYSGVPTTVTFEAGNWDTPRSFTLTAVDDRVDDDGESVLLGFERLPTGVGVSEVAPATATVSIVDDDDPEVKVSFGLPSYDVAEGESVTVTVNLDADPERTVEVPIVHTGEGGADDDDYSGVPDSVTFGATQTTATFTLTAFDDSIDDGVDRGGESVTLGFGPRPDRVGAGRPSTASVTLIDDDGPIDSTNAVSVDFLDFRLLCPSEMAEGGTYACSLSNTADGDSAWPVVGLLHSSGDSGRALVAGRPADAGFCTATAAPCKDNLVTGDDLEAGNWWVGHELVGYSRFAWSGDAGPEQTRRFFVSIVDDDEYEPQEVLYIGVTARERRNINIPALYSNKAEITVSRSDDQSSDASLSELRLLAGGEPVDLGFSATTYSYSVNVPYRATELVVVPVPSHPRAAVSVDGGAVAPAVGAHRGAAVLPLAVGATAVTVVATAEDGTTQRSYTVNVNRADNPEPDDVVKVVSGSFALTCPEAIQESARHDCTLRNNSPNAQPWPVVAVIHSSLDQHRATVAAGSGAGVALATDVRLWPDGGSPQDTYNYGRGELFPGGITVNRVSYGYQKFDLAGQADAGAERAVHLHAPANDDGTASFETFHVSIGPDGYTGLSTLIANRAPIILNEQTGTAGSGDGAGADGEGSGRAEPPAVESLSADETAAAWASLTVSVAGQASAEVAVHVRHRRSDATGTGGWTAVSAPATAGSAEVALWGLDPSTAYRVEASLDPAFPPASTQDLALTTAAAPTLDFESEEFTLRPRAFVWLLGDPRLDGPNSPYDKDADTPLDTEFFDMVRVDGSNIAAEDIEFSVEELPGRVPYRFCWYPDTATSSWDRPVAQLSGPLCADLDLDVLSNRGLLYMFVDGPDASERGAFRADPHVADYPAQRMRLSAHDTGSGLKIYREFIVQPPALPVGCDDYPDSNWDRYNCLFNGERPKSSPVSADSAMINALPADLVQPRNNYSLVFSEEFDTDTECEGLTDALDADVWSVNLGSCDSREADARGDRCVGIADGHYYISISKICSPPRIGTAGKVDFRYGYIEIKYSFPNTSSVFWHNLAVVLGDGNRNRKYALRDYGIDIDGSTETLTRALSMEVDLFEYAPNGKKFISHQYLNYGPMDAAGQVLPRRGTFTWRYCRDDDSSWTAVYRPNLCRLNTDITVVQGLEWTPRGYRRFLKIQSVHHSRFDVVSKDNIRVQIREIVLFESTPDDPVFSDTWGTYYGTNHSAWFEYLDPGDSDSILEQVGVAHVPLDLQIVGWGFPGNLDLLHKTRLEIDYIRVFQPEDNYATMEPVYQ